MGFGWGQGYLMSHRMPHMMSFAEIVVTPSWTDLSVKI